MKQVLHLTALYLYILDHSANVHICMNNILQQTFPFSPISYPSQNRSTEMMGEKTVLLITVFAFASNLSLLSQFSAIFIKGSVISGLFQ